MILQEEKMGNVFFVVYPDGQVVRYVDTDLFGGFDETAPHETEEA